jgi:hypothetical protein
MTHALKYKTVSVHLYLQGTVNIKKLQLILRQHFNPFNDGGNVSAVLTSINLSVGIWM